MFHGNLIVDEIKLSKQRIDFNSDIEILSVLYKDNYYAAVKIIMK